MIFRAHGRFVESLGGRYITAEDVGTSTARHGLRAHGDRLRRRPRRTVRRSVAGHRARRLPRDPGVGEVALGLATTSRARPSRSRAAATSATISRKELHEAGAKLIVTDIDAERVKRVVAEFGAKAVEAGRDLRRRRRTSSRPARSAASSTTRRSRSSRSRSSPARANNQLLEERHGDELEERGHPVRAGLRRQRRRRDQRVQRARRLGRASARCARRTRSTTRCCASSRSRSRTAFRRTRPPIGSPSAACRQWERWCGRGRSGRTSDGQGQGPAPRDETDSRSLATTPGSS